MRHVHALITLFCLTALAPLGAAAWHGHHGGGVGVSFSYSSGGYPGYSRFGYGYPRYGHGYYGHRYGHRYRHGHGYRRHGGYYGYGGHGSTVIIAPPPVYQSAPIYESSARPPVEVIRERAPAVEAVPLLEYLPRDGQGLAQMHSERLACEREALVRTRPAADAGRVARSVRVVSEPVTVATGYGYDRGPIGPAAGGAALGAIGGAIAGDAGQGAAIGAATGAAAWFLGLLSEPGPRYETVTRTREVVTERFIPAAPDPDALRDALVDCMDARGYDAR
jgi:hypothetical protein